MELGEFIKEYNRKLSELTENVQKILYVSLLDAKALIQQRINNKGMNAEGVPFEPYSEGYLKKKKSLGRYRGKVDLQLTGRMWNNIKIVEQRKSDTKIYAILRGEGDIQKQMDGLSDMRSDFEDFLDPSDSEEKIIVGIVRGRVEAEVENLFA